MDLEELKDRFVGRRVQYVGKSGDKAGPEGKVWRVTKNGVWVNLPDGSRQQ